MTSVDLYPFAGCNIFDSITDDVRAALSAFGSAYVSTLAFRDVWGFVGRPALSGYTPYEDVSTKY